jgi:hypothetical protein
MEPLVHSTPGIYFCTNFRPSSIVAPNQTANNNPLKRNGDVDHSRTAGSSRSVCSAQLGRTARWNRRAPRARVRAAIAVNAASGTARAWPFDNSLQEIRNVECALCIPSSVFNIALHLHQQSLNYQSSRPIPNRPFRKDRQRECAIEDPLGLGLT